MKLYSMDLLFFSIFYTGPTRSTTTYHDPAITWAIYLIIVGTFALILGLTNWRLGFWLKEYNVRWLNILIGIAGILIGLFLIYA